MKQGAELERAGGGKGDGELNPQWLEVPEGLTTLLTSREIVPPYSADIAAAWLVVDFYLRALPNGGVAAKNYRGVTQTSYRCGFSWTKTRAVRIFGKRWWHRPLAICLAR